jgi:hypothetical protein
MTNREDAASDMVRAIWVTLIGWAGLLAYPILGLLAILLSSAIMKTIIHVWEN